MTCERVCSGTDAKDYVCKICITNTYLFVNVYIYARCALVMDEKSLESRRKFLRGTDRRIRNGATVAKIYSTISRQKEY